MGVLTLKFYVAKPLHNIVCNVDYIAASGYWTLEIRVNEELVADGYLRSDEDDNSTSAAGNWRVITDKNGNPCLQYKQVGMLVGSFSLSINFTELGNVGLWSLEIELNGVWYSVNHHDGGCQVISFDLKWNRREMLPDDWKFTVSVNDLKYIISHVGDECKMVVSGCYQWDDDIGFPKVSMQFENGVYRTIFSGLPWHCAYTDTWTLEFSTNTNSFLLSQENGVWNVFISGVDWTPSTSLSTKWESYDDLKWVIQIAVTTK